MTEQALLEFEAEYGVKFDKITKVPLEGDGTIERRVERCVLLPYFSRLTDTFYYRFHSIEHQTLCKPQSQPRMDLRLAQRRRHHCGYAFAGVYCIYASLGSVD